MSGPIDISENIHATLDVMSDSRTKIISNRKQLSNQLRASAEKNIQQSLFELPIFNTSNHVGVYHAYAGEVATQPIIEQLFQSEKCCYLPVIKPDSTLTFVHYTAQTELRKNQHHIVEPVEQKNTIVTRELDMVIVPLVAFDQHCHRIGWGQGYYDRTFAFLNGTSRPNKPFLLGLGFELQKLNNIKPQSWDVTLDAIISEQHIYYRD